MDSPTHLIQFSVKWKHHTFTNSFPESTLLVQYRVSAEGTHFYVAEEEAECTALAGWGMLMWKMHECV